MPPKPTTAPLAEALHAALLEVGIPTDHELPLRRFVDMVRIGKGVGYDQAINVVKEGERLGLWARETRNPFPSIIRLRARDDSMESVYRELVKAQRPQAAQGIAADAPGLERRLVVA